MKFSDHAALVRCDGSTIAICEILPDVLDSRRDERMDHGSGGGTAASRRGRGRIERGDTMMAEALIDKGLLDCTVANEALLKKAELEAPSRRCARSRLRTETGAKRVCSFAAVREPRALCRDASSRHLRPPSTE